MVSKCANPQCSAEFYRLSDGKVFSIHSNPRLQASKKPAARVEHFWLCSNCAAKMTVALDRNREVVVLPKKAQTRSAVAS